MSKTLDYQQALRALWGASHMPFGPQIKDLYVPPEREALTDQLARFLAIQSSGMVSGPHGCGKTLLVETLLAELPEKFNAIIRLSHSTLTGSDIIRRLLRLNGMAPSIRRADNIHALLEHWKADTRRPLLLLDEAQNLTPAALEEIRLLLTESERNRTPFTLLLCGDEELPALMTMHIHRSLRTRLAYHLQLHPFPREQTQAYCLFRWNQTGVLQDPTEPQALTLLHDTSKGLPRAINLIAQNALLNAMDQQQRTITCEHINQAIQIIPNISLNSF